MARAFLALWAMLALALASPAHAVGLPPLDGVPATSALFVELVINGQEKGAIVPMRLDGDHPIVAAGDLSAAGLSLAAAGEVDLAATPQLRARYDAPGQRLLIDAAAALLPTNRINGPQRPRNESVADTGAMLNYDLNIQHVSRRISAALWTEQRVFGALGTVSNNGTLRVGGGGRRGYLRYDSRYRYVDEERALAVTVGDLITQSLPWSRSVRLGGLQLARDFRIRPDLLTMPLPSFAGQTAVPSAVDLFVNGYRTARADVNPGRFVLDNMPVVNGAGQATIVTTDAVGRQISTTIPFYVASELLRPGLVDGSAEIGFLRRGYGLRSFGYGAAATSGTLRYGASPHLTVEAHGEATRRLGQAGVGVTWQPGRLGVIDLSAAASRSGGTTGRQVTLGYSYVAQGFSLSAQHSERSRDFRDLGNFDLADYQGMRRTTRAVVTAVIPGQGAVGLAYAGGRTIDGDNSRLVSLSWSRPLGRSASLFAGIDHDLVRGATSAQLRVIVPFGRSSVSGALRHDGSRGALAQLDYQRAVPSDGGLGIAASLAGSADGDAYGQASAQWRGARTTLQGGGAFAASRGSLWGGATGSVAFLAGRTFAANRVNDAFAVVSTDGVADVPVTYENQPIGRTDARGHLFVANISAYHPSRFAIDPLMLAADYAAPMVETRLSLREGTGAVIRMAVHRSRSVSAVLVDRDGRPLAAGDVAARSRGRSATLGWDGIVFLADVDAAETLDVRRRDGAHCRAEIAVPATAHALANLGQIPCL